MATLPLGTSQALDRCPQQYSHQLTCAAEALGARGRGFECRHPDQVGSCVSASALPSLAVKAVLTCARPTRATPASVILEMKKPLRPTRARAER
jgi:hypothetical protein